MSRRNWWFVNFTEKKGLTRFQRGVNYYPSVLLNRGYLQLLFQKKLMKML